MITIIALSGPYKDHSKEVPSHIDPSILLGEFVREKWQWVIDFRHATREEVLVWARADMVCRISAALIHGRVVWFNGVAYSAKNQSDIVGVADAIEDAITNSSKMVFVESDDAIGVTIGTGGTEHQIH
jgi:hypothetical protein